MNIKNIYQKITRGYTDDEMLNVDKFVIEKMKPVINAYVEFACESGMYLPEKYQEDPASWLEVLRKIQFSFNAVNFCDGFVEIYEDRKRVNEGFKLFGQFLLDLRE